MTRRYAIPAAFGLLLCVATFADAQPAPPGHPRDLPSELETELALSALPPHLRAEATVYLLGTDQRFEVARKGTNGFHAFVSRNDATAFHGCWPHTEYRDDILVPIAFDDAGSRAHMQVYFDMAELRAAGITAEEMKNIVTRRYDTGYYRAPDRAGISYMLAPVVRTYADPEKSDLVLTWNVPHYMFYAPGVTNEEIGGKFLSEYPYVLSRSPGPHGYIIQFVGQAEKEAINEEYAEMIDRLCEVRDVYCLPDQTAVAARGLSGRPAG